MFKMTILIMVFASIMLSGCATRIADLTYVSTKSFSLEEFARSKTDGERVQGIDTKHIIIIFPTGTPSAEEALDRAIEKKPGGIALKNATITSTGFYIPWIYGKTSIIVEGEVMVPVISDYRQLFATTID